MVKHKKEMAVNRFELISKKIENSACNSNIEVSSGRELSLEDFKRLVNLTLDHVKNRKQCCALPAHTFAKDLYLFFTDATSKPISYWFDIIKDSSAREWDLKLRSEVSAFIQKWFETNPSEPLRDVSKQKRKNQKQKEERDAQIHRCEFCNRAYKHRRDKEIHLKKCYKRRSYTKKAAVSQHDLSKEFGARKLRRRGKPASKNMEDLFRKKWKISYEKGLEVRAIKNKGYGVTANRVFKKGDFVCEYKGELLEGKKNISQRHKLYNDMGCDVGSYMYEFTFRGKSGFCIDGTRSSGCGRLINHSAKQANVRSTVWDFDGPKLIFVATRRIERCQELVYNYDDRDKDTIASNSWLKM